MRNVFLAALMLVFGNAAALAAEHGVEIKGMKFVPDMMEVAAGDTITFTNADPAPHTATAEDGSFDTGRLAKGESATVTVTAGDHAYKCMVHPMMKGTVAAK